jgi:plastocyanin
MGLLKQRGQALKSACLGSTSPRLLFHWSDDQRSSAFPRRVAPVIALLVLLPMLAACGHSADRIPPATGTGKRVDPATAGTIAGRVVLSGAPPRTSNVKMSADAFCERANPGQAASDETAIVGADGALQNVFVYVKDGLSAYRFDTPRQPVRFEQKGCRFGPHVFGMQVGQPLELVNQDETLHNVHAIARVNEEFNVGAVEHQSITRTFAAPEVMITFKCDVHSWMTAYAGVVPHPYFAVTAADGRFEMKGLPPGDYLIEAWHEKFGTRTERIRIGPKENKAIAFTFTAR